ncbi:hypothetical protein MMC10_002614 [Thelotrema lepadinum]|nr:hypothetical protein [Thelotrema lepadinum]
MSTQGKGNSEQHSRSSQSSNAQDVDPSHSSFNLKEMGASPTARVIVYTALGIIATAESVFWTMWLWEKVAPKSNAKPDNEIDEKVEDDVKAKVEANVNEKVKRKVEDEKE